MATIEPITVETTVNVPVEMVWHFWTTPEDIRAWNNPTEEWKNGLVEVDLRDGGEFLFQMQLKDGSGGFDYRGKYDRIISNQLIELTTSDGRKAINTFGYTGNKTVITETFEPDQGTPIELQIQFCQGVLDSFKKYAEHRFT